MKITVFGAGAIGGHLAARFGQLPENHVSVVDKGEQLARIRANGIELCVGDVRYHAKVNAVDSVDALDVQDLAIVALKSHFLPGAAAELQKLCARAATIVFAGNGIPWWYGYGNDRKDAALAAALDPARLRERVEGRKIVGCVIYSPNAVIAPGVVRCASEKSRFLLGPAFPDAVPACASAAEAFVAAGMSVEQKTDLRPEIWKKLLLNASLSPVATLVMGGNHDVVGDENLRQLCVHILRELLATAKADDIDLTADEHLFDADRLPPHKPSMLQDLEAGRPLEIDSILQAVQGIARAAGVETPTLDTVTSLVTARDRLRRK